MPPQKVENQRPPAEVLFSEELARLRASDESAPRPEGWNLSPRSIVKFVLGDAREGISKKFVGETKFVERCVVALATLRGLMLVGEPGTAKSYLSELLAAAVSGDSSLTIQGSAGTTEDAIRYSWNYALLLAKGPSEEALVPAPLYSGMRDGKVVRFEEITRCPIEIQDVLLSVLSDRVMAIPELPGEQRTLYAKKGFSVIATANLKDRGVNEMSAALKRRFNFETVNPIDDLNVELELVERESSRLFRASNIPVTIPPDVNTVLVTTFHELRRGKTGDGAAFESISTSMSTAEAVATAYAAGVHAHYFGSNEVTPAHVALHIAGSAIKDSNDDMRRLAHYFETVVRKRGGAAWKELYKAKQLLSI